MRDNGEKAVLVTGAGRRIGAAIVRGLHAQGYRVIVHYRRSMAEAQALAGELNGVRPDSVRLLRADLAEIHDLSAMIESAAGHWGGLYGLVNNASAFYPTPFGQVTESQWDELFLSNLKAPFFLAQAAAAYLAPEGGCIVNMVDIYAARPTPGYAVYCIAKAGLAGLTRTLAVELAPKVRVNGIAPGAILWPESEPGAAGKEEILARVPLNRIGSPSDIAGAVNFFLSAAPYVTGQILAVDGGRSLFI